MTKIIPSIETLTGGTADTFIVCAGVGQIVTQKTAAEVRTLLSVITSSAIAAAYQPLGSYAASVHTHTISDVTGLQTAIDGKQDTLVSATNIKTINSTSLLGSGDIAVSASPAGSSGEAQYNNAGAFGGMVAVVYATTVTHVTITAQGATIVPLCVKGAASQSGNLFEVRSSANAKLIEITSAGELLQSTGDLLISGASAGTSGVAVRQNGFSYIRLQPNTGVLVSSSRQFGWTSNSFNISTSADTALSRNAAGAVEINNGTAGTFRDLIVRNLRMASPTLVPASASATGSAGQIAWDADYIYVCTATNTWKRVAIATW